jgi:alkanesulfonate monooxygenase SsuD/methylene tetrahydromethanopterin reductase-like flavin-dependent oxidoreductase (luciferase family)
MLNFQAVHEKKTTLSELVAGLTRDDLHKLTDEMIDALLGLIAGCVDADVTFQPVDPQAHDPYAVTPEELHLAWNLGHVIVHTTASAEESAAIAAELARGVAYHGRSRYEVPWGEMRTITACRQRLEESRRMRLASLGMWPEAAHLDNEYQAWTDGPQVNAIGRFVLGLMHEESHLGQIGEIVRQASAVRGSL